MRNPIAIKEALDKVVITKQTFLLHDSSVKEETVTTLFPFPGAWIEILMVYRQAAAYILNLIENKILLATNDAKTSFITMVTWLRAETVQSSRNNNIQPQS